MGINIHLFAFLTKKHANNFKKIFSQKIFSKAFFLQNVTEMF